MNKTELKKKCSNILNSSIHSLIEGEDFDFLCNLFKKHPEYELKTKGQKIVGITVKKADRYNTKCFYIIREDGSETDISFNSCIDCDNRKKKDINNACRDAIEPIIFAKRKEVVLPFKCPISGEMINNMNDVHIDHYNLDFKDVVSRWINIEGGVDTVHKYVCNTTDNKTVTCFTDSNIKNSFINFHNKNTHLRAIHKKANLTRKKKGNRE